MENILFFIVFGALAGGLAYMLFFRQIYKKDRVLSDKLVNKIRTICAYIDAEEKSEKLNRLVDELMYQLDSKPRLIPQYIREHAIIHIGQARTKMRFYSPRTGIGRVASERARQITQLGYTPRHDRDNNASQELIHMALDQINQARAHLGGVPITRQTRVLPSEDPIRHFEKAGALLCAVIDRYLTIADKPPKT